MISYRPGVDDQRLTDDVPCGAERALPVAVSQDHAVRRARNVVLLANESAEFGANSEQREHPIRDPQRLYLFRLAVSNDGHVPGVPQADILEDPGIVAVGEVGGGDSAGVRAVPNPGARW